MKRDKSSKFDYNCMVMLRGDNEPVFFLTNEVPVVGPKWLTFNHIVHDDVDDDALVNFLVDDVVMWGYNRGEWSVEDLAD